MTTTAIAKVETQNTVGTYAGIFGDALIERFVKFAGVAEASVKTYKKSLRQMFRYFADNAIAAPTRENLIDWVEGLNAAGKSMSTIQLYLASAKLFFRWLAQEQVYPNVADHLKFSWLRVGSGHKKDSLDVAQCRTLVESVRNISKVKEKHNTLTELRDRAILSLLVTAGLRTVEVVRADVGDIVFNRGKIFLRVLGKRRAEKDDKNLALLSKQTYAHIQAYLKVRGKVGIADPLFASASNRNFGARLDTQTIRALVKKNLRSIGLDSPRLTAHSLRHSVATNLIEQGVDLPDVQNVLRHAKISTSMVYIESWKRINNNSEQILADVIFGGKSNGTNTQRRPHGSKNRKNSSKRHAR